MLTHRPLTSPAALRRAALVAAVGALSSFSACGDDGAASADGTARLEASLGFLSSEYQFSSDQVGCVREQLERRDIATCAVAQ
ncbi:hypothetical protein BH24ACT4_BH24ACT4_18440 [soil metagenome]